MLSLSNFSISRVGRLWRLLPILVIPALLGFCFFVSSLFGSSLTVIVILLSVAQIVASILVWKNWKGTDEQLTSVNFELSTLQSIVDVSRDAIIGVTPDGVIMSWNRGARVIYGYTAKEALGSPISMLYDHRRGQEATLLFERSPAAKTSRNTNWSTSKRAARQSTSLLPSAPFSTEKRSPAPQSWRATSPNASAPRARWPNRPPR